MRYLSAILIFAASCALGAERDLMSIEGFRRPVALCISADARWIYTANQRSGSLSVVDAAKNQVVAEVPLGGRPSAMIWAESPEGSASSTLIVTLESSHELAFVKTDGPTAKVVQRIPVAKYPVSLTTGGASQIFVASLWSQRLTMVQLESGGKAWEPETTKTKTLDLPWAPRCLLRLPNGQLLVADAFGGRLGVVDVQQWKLLYVRQFPSHNIRGLGLSREKKKVIIAHQMLNELAHTIRNDVHWGLLMSNDLRYVPVTSFLKSKGDLYQFNHMHPLGEAGSATSDPSGLAIAPDGTAVVTLGGVGEIAIGREEEFSLRRVKVGKRPTGATLSVDGKLAIVANTFDDSVTIVDMESREAKETISLGTSPKLSLADRGELLFYDGSLSHDSWMSCHSCHPDGHTNGQLNDNLSDFNTFGAPKRVLSLLGKRDTAPFAWNGSAETYEQQISNSIAHTMQSDRDPRPRDVEALTAYLQTLESPPSIDAARETLDLQAIGRGKAIFERHDCKRCHQGEAYTSSDTYDVGLEDELGRREFNPPSLRGVSQRSALLHDGRAKSLSDVFGKHQHQLDEPLKDKELADVIAFLRSL